MPTKVDIPHLNDLYNEIGEIALLQICENMKNEPEALKGVNIMTLIKTLRTSELYSDIDHFGHVCCMQYDILEFENF